MSDPRIRREIALRAAQLMYSRQEKEYFTAKRKAGRMVAGSPRPSDLPSNREIRDEILILAEMIEGDGRKRGLRRMRLEALRVMRGLARFRPRLIGSVLTGHVRSGSDIDIHVFADSVPAVTGTLEEMGLEFRVERKRVLKHDEERVFTHVHVEKGPGGHEVELTVYGADKVSYPFRSSITGKTMERATVEELEKLLREEEPGCDLEGEMAEAEVAAGLEVWELFRSLLVPLEGVKQNPKFHPEGDALYHSLQVFERAREARPWDEEFLLAALLHDVGKAIDPADHVRAGVEALRGAVTARTLFLIEHHMEAHEYRARTLGARARRRLEASEDFEDLMLLSEMDEAGRVVGARVGSVEEVLEWLKGMGEDR